MGSPTYAQFALTQDDLLTQGVGTKFSLQDFFTRSIPVVPIVGRGETHNREDTDPATLVGTVDVGGTPIATPGDITQVTHLLGRIGSEVELDSFERKTRGAKNDPLTMQIRTKTRGTWQTYSNLVITGSNSFPNPAGLQTLLDTTNQLFTVAGTTTAGNVLSFGILDEVLELVDMPGSLDQLQNGDFEGVPFLAVPKALRPDLLALYRALGAASIERVTIGMFDPDTGAVVKRDVPAYNGVPIHFTAGLSTETTFGASSKYRVYAGVFGEDEGLHAIIPAGAPFLEIGTPTHKPGSMNQVLPVELITGLSMKSQKALAAASNIIKA